MRFDRGRKKLLRAITYSLNSMSETLRPRSLVMMSWTENRCLATDQNVMNMVQHCAEHVSKCVTAAQHVYSHITRQFINSNVLRCFQRAGAENLDQIIVFLEVWGLVLMCHMMQARKDIKRQMPIAVFYWAMSTNFLDDFSILHSMKNATVWLQSFFDPILLFCIIR